MIPTDLQPQREHVRAVLLEDGDRDLGRRRLELGVRELGLQPVLLAHVRVIVQLSDPPDQPLPIAVDAVVEVARQVVDIGLLSVAAQVDGAMTRL